MIGDLKCCLIGLSGNSALCATRVGCAMSAPWLLPAAIGVRKWEGSGAPRSMKMGTILSPCPYDAAADRASQLAKLRHPTTLQYASRPRCLLEFAWCSGYPSIACSLDPPDRRDVPCVDGSELARVFFTFAGWSVQPCVRPVSAAHRPLAIMPSADQVPVKSPHSTMRWHMWVVLIAGIDRLCITCCSPSQPSHHADGRRDLVYTASATGSL